MTLIQIQCCVPSDLELTLALAAELVLSCERIHLVMAVCYATTACGELLLQSLEAETCMYCSCVWAVCEPRCKARGDISDNTTFLLFAVSGIFFM